MSYIAELINKECPECQGEKVAVILARNGVVNPMMEHYYNVWTFFIDKKAEWLKQNKTAYQSEVLAGKDTQKEFKISRFYLIRTRKRFED